jgi:hypothetical protein
MKRNQLLILSLLAVALQNVSTGSALAELTARGEIVEASPFSMDGQGPFDLPALESYAERHARSGGSSEPWGVSRREVEPHDPYPFGGGLVGD